MLSVMMNLLVQVLGRNFRAFHYIRIQTILSLALPLFPDKEFAWLESRLDTLDARENLEMSLNIAAAQLL